MAEAHRGHFAQAAAAALNAFLKMKSSDKACVEHRCQWRTSLDSRKQFYRAFPLHSRAHLHLNVSRETLAVAMHGQLLGSPQAISIRSVKFCKMLNDQILRCG